MRRFILIDLYSQMPYLPLEMRSWPRERVLMWMRQFGEVQQSQWSPYLNEEVMARSGSTWCPIHDADDILPEYDTFGFRSFLGFVCVFVYRAPGDIFVPGQRHQAWSAWDQG